MIDRFGFLVLASIPFMLALILWLETFGGKDDNSKV